MRRIFATFSVLFACLAPAAQGQTFYSGTEYGVSIGGSQYFGDLNENIAFKFIRPAGGVFVRYHLNPFISLRASVNYTHVGYDDNLNDNAFNKTRNLSFRSNILEGVVQAEFNFFRFYTGDEKSRFTPYLTGGVGAFYYNPYTTYLGRNYDLRPLGTEGQNAGFQERRYNSVSMCFPVGRV